MSVGNYGAAKNLLQGLVATEFIGSTLNPQGGGQGVAMFPELIERIAAQSHFTEANLKVYGPALFDGTNDVTVTSSAAKLLGLIVASTSAQAEDAAVLIYEAAVTEGTTRYVAMVNVNAAASQATAEAVALVFPQPVPCAQIRWSAVDNGADGDIEGTTLADANGVKVLIVYAQ